MENEKRNLNSFYKNKKGQVTIFIIIAVLVVVAGVLIYMFFPGFQTPSEKADLEDPQRYIQDCVSDEMKEVVQQVSLQGGSLEPEASYQYQGREIEYSCYSDEYYEFCSVQIPFLRDHVEKEIKSGISGQVENCFSSLEEEYEKEGFNLNIQNREMDVRLLPESIVANLNKTINLRKGETSEKHENFKISLNNNLYQRVNVAESIVEFESSYGSADSSMYMNMYHNLLVYKKEQSDETTIYIIEDVNTGNKFQFASRSLAFPPGYGEPPERLRE